MIDFKMISMVSKGLPCRQMTNGAPCGSLQQLITSPSNSHDVGPTYHLHKFHLIFSIYLSKYWYVKFEDIKAHLYILNTFKTIKLMK